MDARRSAGQLCDFAARSEDGPEPPWPASETPDELAAVRQRFEAANRSTTIAQPNSHCCYAVSDKHWVTDPQGIAWEAFHSLDTIPLYSGSTAAEDSASGCCAPVTAQREGLSERRAGAPLAGMRAIANHGQRPKGDITALHSGSAEAERGPACRAASERETLVDPDTRRSSHATQKEGPSDPLLGVIENAAPNKVASGGACCR